MNNIKIYELISNVISLMKSNENSSSIKSMSAACNVPVEYMRKLMTVILENQVLQSCINIADDFDENEDLSFIEKYLDNPAYYTKQIIDGKYDDLLWELNFNILDTSEEELLSLSQIEYVAITMLGEDIISLKRGAVFEKKDTINPISLTVRKNQEIIQTAINNKQEIVFNYKKGDEVSSRRCFPKEIFVNISDNWLYFSSTDNKSYRLDRIVHTCKVIKSNTPYPEVAEDSKQKYVWGIFRGIDDTPTHVKLRIYPETKNIVSKIKRDLRLRSSTCSFYQDGEYYYYEDDIIGLDEFQRWLRSYGSSIEAIEPASLRKNIVNDAKKALNYYNTSQQWTNI